METGFIYLWFDKKNRKFYLGSHFGKTNDGYIGSGVYFSRAYKRRPQDFKRRIVQLCFGSKTEIREQEAKWLNLITDEKLSNRYYNLNRQALGGSMKGRTMKPWTEERKIAARKPKSDQAKANMKGLKSPEHKEKIKESLAGKPKSASFRERMIGHTVSEETKKKISDKAKARHAAKLLAPRV